MATPEWFGVMFERHHAQVAAYVRRRAPESIVEDVVSETFLIAWRASERVRGDPLPWLYGVARRVLANQLRGQRRRLGLVSRLRRERSPSDPEPLPGVSERIRAALLALSERDREAVLLVAWEGLTPNQAAAAVGCTAGTFRARLYRARRQLARTLGSSPVAETGTGVALEAGEA